jgi:NDP-sugar pyrophosphorylase family protein
MLPIENKPMLMHGFDQLRAAGITEISVTLGPFQEGEEGVTISGNIHIGEGTTVHRGSGIPGPIVVGNNSDIAAGAYIGSYTIIEVT